MSAPGETLIRERTLSLPLRSTSQTHLEIIRFAASNRLCVDLDYQGRTRRIEPYSLRRTQDVNIILHAWSAERNEHRSYGVDRIEGCADDEPDVHAALRHRTDACRSPFLRPLPRTSPGGTIGFPTRSPRPVSSRAPRSTPSALGPTYVYECSYCGKKFRRKSQASTLNAHKDKSGYRCPGRSGFWVDTQY